MADKLDDIQLPPSFSIALYAEVPDARSLTLSDAGILYVSNRRGNSVYAVVDRNGDQTGETVVEIVDGLRSPNGLTWHAGDLYIADVDRLLKITNIDERFDKSPSPQLLADDFPSDRSHGWRYLRAGPDNKLYMAIGAPCNICNEPGYARIIRMNLDAGERETWAAGVRNSVGFDFHPATGALWFTDNGRDWLGDDLPPDEINAVTEPGQHFGYPHCHGGTLLDDEFGQGHDCQQFAAPVQNLGAHVAPLGMRFYTGDMFPERYHGKIFVAEHGSWNRSTKVGYRVVLIDPEATGSGRYQSFAEGWLKRSLFGDSAWGRPADVLVMPDGALLVSDDQQGAIYRISYSGD